MNYFFAILLTVLVGCAHREGAMIGGTRSVPSAVQSEEKREPLLGAQDGQGRPVKHLVIAGREVKNLDFDMPVTINGQVEKWIEYFTQRGRPHMERYLTRSGQYREDILATLKAHGVPQDLFYVALIESGFNLRAQSHASAVGPWQFIRGTGSRYGLRINYWIDERKNIEKATVAAAKYFTDLYGMFGDWELAKAGYNAGEGKIMRAISMHRTRNFWEMTAHSYLRNETKNYVPKFVAAALIDKNREAFGFDHIQDNPPVPYEEVSVQSPIDLFAMAKELNLTFGELRDLNPELLRWTTPADLANYSLRVPQGMKARGQEIASNLQNQNLQVYRSHVVRKGETVATIARRYGIPAEYVRLMNNLPRRGKLRAGTRLKIPLKEGQKARGVEQASESQAPVRRVTARLSPKNTTRQPAKASVRTHTVRRGETLEAIARRYDISVSELRRANRQTLRRGLMAGSRLRIPLGG